MLRAFVELYCNFTALEDRVFTMDSPWSFFTMFGNPGGAISADMAIEAFEDDVKVTSRQVCDVIVRIWSVPDGRFSTSWPQSTKIHTYGTTNPRTMRRWVPCPTPLLLSMAHCPLHLSSNKSRDKVCGGGQQWAGAAQIGRKNLWGST